MLIAGVDEAGRGPLAGPVVAAAVILDPECGIDGLHDSKKMTARQREAAFALLHERAIAIGIGQADCREIDTLNILHATMLAMRRAVENLDVRPGKALIDGNRCPTLDVPADAVVSGDALVPCISAASIVAKVVRDRIMLDLHAAHPQYGFDRHKGYPTKEHRNALAEHGPTSEHRRSFSPVRACLDNSEGA